MTDPAIADNFAVMDNKSFPLLWLLVTVFFIRALVPAGFMPDLSGKHILTICSGTGTSTIIVDDNNQPVSDSPSHTPDQSAFADSCPFSFLSTALLTDPLTNAVFVKPPISIAEGMPAVFLSSITSFTLITNYPSRAPPQLS